MPEHALKSYVDGLLSGRPTHYCKVRRAAALSLTTGFNAISWDTEDFDSGLHDNSTNPTRFTATQDGYYYLFGGYLLNTGIARSFGYWTKNGSASHLARSESYAGTGGSNAVTVSAAVFLAAGDYVEFGVYVSTGASFVTGTDQTNSFASVFGITVASLVAAPTYVTSLPGSPVDGQEVYYAADATNGVIWHLRYRSGASGSYKWEFVGGPPLSAEVLTNETTASTSFTDLTTVGPSITLPLAGDYVMQWQAQMLNGTNPQMGVKYGAVAMDGDDTVINGTGGSTASNILVTGMRRKTALAASIAVKAQYAVTAGTGNFLRRRLTVTPIRVG